MNREGRFVAPTTAHSPRRSSASTGRNQRHDVSLINPPGAASWPIAGATFVLMRQHPADVAATRAALDFFTWAYREGGAAARDLHYVRCPENPAPPRDPRLVARIRM